MPSEIVHAPRRSMAEKLLVWLQRIVAVYCLVFGVLYWARIVGLQPGSGWRFDLMPFHWQVASLTFAVFFPFAAIGLWMLASWGPVIWAICAGSQVAMFGFFPELFGENRLAIAAHGLAALLYIVLRGLIFMQNRRAAVSAH